MLGGIYWHSKHLFKINLNNLVIWMYFNFVLHTSLYWCPLAVPVRGGVDIPRFTKLTNNTQQPNHLHGRARGGTLTNFLLFFLIRSSMKWELIYGHYKEHFDNQYMLRLTIHKYQLGSKIQTCRFSRVFRKRCFRKSLNIMK